MSIANCASTYRDEGGNDSLPARIVCRSIEGICGYAMRGEAWNIATQEYNAEYMGVYPTLKEKDYKLFGVGNDITTNLYDLKITHKEGLNYNVRLRYSPDCIMSNEITLVPNGDAFLIDYASTEWIQLPDKGREGDGSPLYVRRTGG